MTPRFNDLQLVLLSHAARNEAGHVFPLPVTVTDQARAQRELKALLRRELLAETETTNPAASWRSDEDLHFSLVITEQARAAIGLGEAEATGDAEFGTPSPASATSAPLREVLPARKAERQAALGAPRAASKIAGVIALLSRKEGATLAELIEATGWQEHTTRAALTGLRKKGHVIEKTRRGEATSYIIVAEMDQ